MHKLKTRITYANVVSTLALFAALGGASAFAASQLRQNSVGSRELKPRAVKTGNLARNAVKTGKLAPEAAKAGKIAKNSITTDRLRDNAVTGVKVNEVTLGKVPSAEQADKATAADTATNAEKLGGRGPDAFVEGGGESLAGRAILALGGGGKQHILDVPGYGEVVGGCGSGGAAVGFINESGGDLRMLAVAGSEASAVTLESGVASTLFPPGVGSAGLTVLQIGSTDFADQELLTVMATREAQSGGKCGVQAWAVTR